MAHPDLRARHPGARRRLGALLREPSRAFASGQERQALTLLGRLVEDSVPGSVEWALLERLRGLVLIHVLREVEGTFALERADAVLDHTDLERPTLAWLEAPAGAPEGGRVESDGADAEQSPGSLESR